MPYGVNLAHPCCSAFPQDTSNTPSQSKAHQSDTSYFDLDAYASSLTHCQDSIPVQHEDHVWTHPTLPLYEYIRFQGQGGSTHALGHSSSYSSASNIDRKPSSLESRHNASRLNPSGRTNTVPAASKTPILGKKTPLTRTTNHRNIPHSAVEKKYRYNLNAKLVDLQQCIPALSAKPKDDCARRCSGLGEKDIRLEKGLILSSAAHYIRMLQARTSDLEVQNKFLRHKACGSLDACSGAIRAVQAASNARTFVPQVFGVQEASTMFWA